MDAYETEQEQLEKIKKWWDENGKAIVIGLVLGVSGIFGYRYWESNRILSGESASINFEHLLAVAQAGQSDAATTAGDALINGQSDTPYAKMAAMLLAKLAVDASDFSAAKQRLEWVVNHPKSSELTAIAQARLAQILMAEGDVDSASSTFAKIENGLQSNYPELKGDIALAGGDLESARAQYRIALDQAVEHGIDQEPIKLKIENMSFIHAQKR